jgi:hypothetical protein
MRKVALTPIRPNASVDEKLKWLIDAVQKIANASHIPEPERKVMAATIAAWTAYTPTVSASSGTITTSSATGRFHVIGKTVHFTVTITITTNGTGSGALRFTLPKLCRNNSIAAGRGEGGSTTGDMMQARLSAGSSTVNVFNFDNAYPGSDGATIYVSGSYEAN